MRFRPVAVAALVTAAALLIVSSALAQQRVVLVRPSNSDAVLLEAFNRLRAELVLQGLEPAIVERPSGTSPDALAELARSERAFACIALSRSSKAARIAIADRVTGKTSLRTISLGDEPDAPTVLAVRASDLLRASLREYTEEAAPPPEVIGVDPAPPSDVVERWAREPTSRFRMEARAALLAFTEPSARAAATSFALEYRPFERFGFGAILLGPSLSSSFESEFGKASSRHLLALGRGSLAVFRGGDLELRALLAAGAYRLEARGEVEFPLVSRSAEVWSFAGGAELELSHHLTSAIVVAGGVSALMLNPRPAVAVLSDEVRFALPFMTASAGLGVVF